MTTKYNEWIRGKKDPQIKLIAQFLEDTTREQEETQRSHPLDMVPRDEETWRGWVYDAERLRKSLDTMKANMTATEMVLHNMKIKREKAENIVYSALRHAISEGLKLNDPVCEWRGSREQYAANVNTILNDWLIDEDGSLAIDRLVTLIIH